VASLGPVTPGTALVADCPQAASVRVSRIRAGQQGLIIVTSERHLALNGGEAVFSEVNMKESLFYFPYILSGWY